jgi:myo-inositol-1(or 4)-monophosphatase
MNSGNIPSGALDVAVPTAREAGAVLREKLGQVAIEYKGTVDLVTEADRASEALIASRLSEAFPDHRMVGEEGIARQSGAGADAPYAWIVDPLDGTTNFAHSYPHFAVSLALAYMTEVVLGVVYDPMRDELFVAEQGSGATLNGKTIRVSTVDTSIRSLLATGFSYDLSERSAQLETWAAIQANTQGIRRDGAAALNLCYVAAGRLDGFWEQPLQPWDMAAGSLIIQEAGGVVTDYTGGTFAPFGNGVIAGNYAIHSELLDIIVTAQLARRA